MRATLWENVSTLKPYDWPSSDMPSSRPPAVDIDASPCAPNEKVGRLIWGELRVPKTKKRKRKERHNIENSLSRNLFRLVVSLLKNSLPYAFLGSYYNKRLHTLKTSILTVLALHFSLPYSLCKSIGSLWNIQGRSTRYHAVLFIIKRTWRWLTLRHKIEGSKDKSEINT